ncbi:MAG: flagellar hook assembly protein FlgD [Lysinibacillus sp.]
MTGMTGITDDLNYSNYKKPVKETGNSSLGKDAFLKLLITQLQNQDPTNPMDDRDFIAQMAQFSSLEQMQNMTKGMEALLMSQQQTQLMSYSSFVGKEIKWHELTEELDSAGKPVAKDGTGVIQSLKFVDGGVVFILEDGKEIFPGNISEILGGASSSTGKPENPIVEASKLIGRTVTYLNGETEMQGKVVSVSNKDGVISYVLDNGEKLSSKDFTVVSE